MTYKVTLFLSEELLKKIQEKKQNKSIYRYLLDLLNFALTSQEDIQKLINENEELKKQIEELRKELEKRDASIQTIINEKLQETKEKTIKEFKEKIKMKLKELADSESNEEKRKVYLDLILVISQL